MTNREVVDKILAYHPKFPEDYHGCDDWKTGNPDDECTGIVTTLAATVNVVRKAAELGANLIIVHEPTFYTSEDGPGWFEDFPNEVYEEKRRIIDEHGIAIWRDHDHIHTHEPDGIFTGMVKYMGWEGKIRQSAKDGMMSPFIVDFPEMTLRELCRNLIEKLGINGLRYVGDPDAKVKSMAMVGHLYPNSFPASHRDGSPAEYSVSVIDVLESEADVLLPGEVIDWTVLSYARDAMQLGKNKAVISIGHFNGEELGMKYAEIWLGELIGHCVPITYVPTEDMYGYEVRE